MFNFKEELAKYRESLEVSDLSGGVSGDEVRDILDIAKELVNARGNKQVAEAEKPAENPEKARNAEKPEQPVNAEKSVNVGKSEPEAGEGSENKKAAEEKAE